MSTRGYLNVLFSDPSIGDMVKKVCSGSSESCRVRPLRSYSKRLPEVSFSAIIRYMDSEVMDSDFEYLRGVLKAVSPGFKFNRVTLSDGVVKVINLFVE